MNLRDQSGRRAKYPDMLPNKFTEAHIAKQNPATQERMRRRNEKVEVARALRRAQKEAAKREKSEAK